LPAEAFGPAMKAVGALIGDDLIGLAPDLEACAADPVGDTSRDGAEMRRVLRIVVEFLEPSTTERFLPPTGTRQSRTTTPQLMMSTSTPFADVSVNCLTSLPPKEPNGLTATMMLPLEFRAPV
jgi:hypothetical protein